MQVERGKLLGCPAQCPDAVYQLMLDCWRRHPRDRITMASARRKLSEIRRRHSHSPSASAAATMTVEGQQSKVVRQPFDNEVDVSRPRNYLELIAND